MVHVIFDGSDVKLENYFQVGSGLTYFEGLPPYQRGYGYFAGIPRQRGNGSGDIFRSLWRVLKPYAISAGRNIVPVVKSAGRAIGEEGLATGARVLTELVQGKDVGETLKNEGQEGVRRLLEKASNKIPQRGSGRRRKTKMSQVILNPSDLIGRTVSKNPLIKSNNSIKKRKRCDSLGYY